MSDIHAYTPRFDGIFYDGGALPARDPQTGRFVGNTPDVHDPAWHDDTQHPQPKIGFIRIEDISTEMLPPEWRSREISEEEIAEDAANCAAEDAYYEDLAARGDEYDWWFYDKEDYNGYGEYRGNYIDDAEGAHLMNQDVAEAVDLEYLPNGQRGSRKIYMIHVENETCGHCHSRARQPYAKGRHNKVVMAARYRRNKRKLARSSHQADADVPMTAEDYLDAHLVFDGDWVDEEQERLDAMSDEEIWAEMEEDYWEAFWAEQDHYHTLHIAFLHGEFGSFPGDQEFTAESIRASKHLREQTRRQNDFLNRYEFGVLTKEDVLYLDDPWGAEHYDMAYPEDDPHDDGVDYDDPMMWGPTQEEWEAMEAEDRAAEEAAEAAAEALEAQFEHVPSGGHGIGKMAQKASQVLIRV